MAPRRCTELSLPLTSGPFSSSTPARASVVLCSYWLPHSNVRDHGNPLRHLFLLHIGERTHGHFSSLVYWHLLTPATTPPLGTILRNPSWPQVYHGYMATHDWFPEIFGRLDSEATLITLDTKEPQTPRGLASGTLSSLASLPLTVVIYLATPYLPPSYIGPLEVSTHLTSPDGGLVAQVDTTTQHVYLTSTPAPATPLCIRLSITGFIESHSPWPSRRTTSLGDLSCIVILWINRRPGPDFRRYS